jgi:hypothetical protein
MNYAHFSLYSIINTVRSPAAYVVFIIHILWCDNICLMRQENKNFVDGFFLLLLFFFKFLVPLYCMCNWIFEGLGWHSRAPKCSDQCSFERLRKAWRWLQYEPKDVVSVVCFHQYFTRCVWQYTHTYFLKKKKKCLQHYATSQDQSPVVSLGIFSYAIWQFHVPRVDSAS